MKTEEKDLNECLAHIARFDLAVATGNLPTKRYMTTRRRVVASALEAIRRQEIRNRLVRRTLRIHREKYGLSPVQIITILWHVARIVQAVWTWWREERSNGA
jgi:hypothetical protein